jgi:ribosome-binding factor A
VVAVTPNVACVRVPGVGVADHFEAWRVRAIGPRFRNCDPHAEHQQTDEDERATPHGEWDPRAGDKLDGMGERMRRINESVRQVLSEGVGALNDPRIGLVTITGVETSRDLRHARVFVSVLGSEQKREQSLAGLQAAHGVLQARLGRELRMKWTPQLAFEYDPTVERGVRMTRLIDELAPDDSVE